MKGNAGFDSLGCERIRTEKMSVVWRQDAVVAEKTRKSQERMLKPDERHENSRLGPRWLALCDVRVEKRKKDVKYSSVNSHEPLETRL